MKKNMRFLLGGTGIAFIILILFSFLNTSFSFYSILFLPVILSCVSFMFFGKEYQCFRKILIAEIVIKFLGIFALSQMSLFFDNRIVLGISFIVLGVIVMGLNLWMLQKLYKYHKDNYLTDEIVATTKMLNNNMAGILVGFKMIPIMSILFFIVTIDTLIYRLYRALTVEDTKIDFIAVLLMIISFYSMYRMISCLVIFLKRERCPRGLKIFAASSFVLGLVVIGITYAFQLKELKNVHQSSYIILLFYFPFIYLVFKYSKSDLQSNIFRVHSNFTSQFTKEGEDEDIIFPREENDSNRINYEDENIIDVEVEEKE